MSRESDELPQTMFRISCILAVFLTGFLCHATRTWPYALIEDGLAAFKDLALNAKAYAGIEPTLEIFPAPNDRNGLTRYDAAKTSDGLIFMPGLFDHKTGMKLIANDGREIKRWDVSYMNLFPNMDHVQPAMNRPINDWNTNLHGVQPLPDGSVVVNFDGYGLARVDLCGTPVWTLPRMTHHSISMTDAGTMWVPERVYHAEETDRLPLHKAPFYEDRLLEISLDGKVLRDISVPEAIIKNGLEGLMYANGFDMVFTEAMDYMHLNDIDVLSKDIAAAFPDFEAGDLAISLRNLNLVFVLDPDTGKIKWYQVGPWTRQHDPDFLADGTIMIFDNRKDNTLRGDILKGSTITTINPKTREVRVAYQQAKTADDPGFYTYMMGKQQPLMNGNLMIAQPTYGRVFEVTKAGEVVWEFYNRYDEKRVAMITEATRYPQSYFTVKDWTCKQESAAQ